MMRQRPDSSALFKEFYEDEVSKNKRGVPWIRLEEALHREGCPICEIVSASTRRHLTTLLYECVLDVSVRNRLHASFGLCNLHAWMATGVERALGSDGQHLGTMHESLVQQEVHLLHRASPFKRRRKWKWPLRRRNNRDPVVQRLLNEGASRGECLVCESARQLGEFYASQCVLMCPDNEFRSLYESETVLLCRHHFHSVLLAADEPALVDFFIGRQIVKLDRLSAQLTLFLEKHDIHRMNESRGKEWTSWLSALEYFSGKQGVNDTKDTRQLPILQTERK